MTMLGHHRRDHRDRAPKRRRRRNLVKFIPTSDSDFAFVAENVFLPYLKGDPAAYGLSAEDVASIDKVVTEYRIALAKSLHKISRTQRTIRDKDGARKKAEEIVRRFANIVRANPDVSTSRKTLMRIKERPKTLKSRKCPKNPPMLMFKGSRDGAAFASGPGGGSGVHVLKFYDYVDNGIRDVGTIRRAKPDGAVRLELFVDLVPPGEAIPSHPGQLSGRPWYLRSFTKSPIEVEYPIPSIPMLVVYWARWADATGEVGRFSKTCVARVEGWSASGNALPDASQSGVQRIETKYVLIQAPYELPDHLNSDEVINLSRQLTSGAALAPGGRS